MSRDSFGESAGSQGTHGPPSTPAIFRGLRAAFALGTRLPVGGFPYRREDWAWALGHMPLVGFVLGATLALVDRTLLPLGRLPAAILTLAVSLVATGALHEDGLADTSDALGGAATRDRVLVILKDSRIGTYGAAALLVSIGARATLLAELGPAAWWALPLSYAGARIGPVWLVYALPYVTDPERAKNRDVASANLLQALVATMWFVAFAIVAIRVADSVSAVRLLVLGVLLATVTAASGYQYRRRAGGVTGDFLGATEQIGEIAALAVLAYGVAS